MDNLPETVQSGVERGSLKHKRERFKNHQNSSGYSSVSENTSDKSEGGDITVDSEDNMTYSTQEEDHTKTAGTGSVVLKTTDADTESTPTEVQTIPAVHVECLSLKPKDDPDLIVTTLDNLGTECNATVSASEVSEENPVIPDKQYACDGQDSTDREIDEINASLNGEASSTSDGIIVKHNSTSSSGMTSSENLILIKNQSVGVDEVDMGMGRCKDNWERTGAIPKFFHSSNLLKRRSDSSNDSGSESDEEKDIDTTNDSDAFCVQDKEIKEVEKKVSHHPTLFSQKSTNSLMNNKIIHHEDIVTVEDCDGMKGDSASSVSPLDSNMSEYKIMKRKSAPVKIAGNTDFFKLQTVKYEHKKTTSRQHYMKHLPDHEKDVEGDIGLRPGDQLLEVNGKSLEAKTQKKVLSIFKSIYPKKDRQIHINLVFRRWEIKPVDGKNRVFEVDYLLKLVLKPDIPELQVRAVTRFLRLLHRRRTERDKEITYKVADKTQEETKQVELGKGQIDGIVPKGKATNRIKPLHVGEEEFVTVDHDGLISLQPWNDVTATKNVFGFQFFRGIDKSQEPLSSMMYCTRISCPGPVGCRYLTSDLESHTQLIFQTSRIQAVKSPDDVDETCFILRELGSDVLFESLLHRGLYIGCEQASNRVVQFMMIKKSKHEVIHDSELQNLKFNLFAVKEEKVTVFQRIFQSDFIQSLFSCTGRSTQIRNNQE